MFLVLLRALSLLYTPSVLWGSFAVFCDQCMFLYPSKKKKALTLPIQLCYVGLFLRTNQFQDEGRKIDSNMVDLFKVFQLNWAASFHPTVIGIETKVDLYLFHDAGRTLDSSFAVGDAKLFLDALEQGL